LLHSTRLRSLPPAALQALLRAPQAQRLLAAASGERATETLLAAAAAAAGDASCVSAFWAALRALFVGQASPAREAALHALPQLLAQLCPVDEFETRPAAVHALAAAARAELLAALRDARTGKDVEALLRCWLAEGETLRWDDLLSVRAHVLGHSARRGLLRRVAACLRSAPVSIRGNWLLAALEATSALRSAAALTALATLCAEWHAPSAMLCLADSPGADATVLAALPASLPAVAAACNLVDAAAAAMLHCAEEASVRSLALAALRSLRDELADEEAPRVLSRAAALDCGL
jgi:hypothetical protein